jgi:hypothetical protein
MTRLLWSDRSNWRVVRPDGRGCVRELKLWYMNVYMYVSAYAE